MSWKSKMYILANLGGQVNRLPTVQFLLQGKGVDGQPGLELIQTGHASQAHAKLKAAGREEAAPGQPHIQTMAERRAGPCAGLFQLKKAGVFFTLDMKSSALRNLAQMNLHG